MRDELELIICTERGYIEKMSMLLVYTLRNYGGEYKNIPIFSYSPRRFKAPRQETLNFFDKYQVNVVDTVLNKHYEDYPLANKPLACAHREQSSTSKYLLFLDSDSFFLSEPNGVFCGDFNVKLNPVNFPNIATDKEFKTGESAYWRLLYDTLKIDKPRTVRCRITKKKIIEYYNSGFILIQRDTGVFSKWKQNFEKIMRFNIRPNAGNFYVEQSTLSATISQMNINVSPLGLAFNYPVRSYINKWRGFYPFSLNGIHHIHYHKSFKREKSSKAIIRKLTNTPNGTDLIKAIKKLLLN